MSEKKDLNRLITLSLILNSLALTPSRTNPPKDFGIDVPDETNLKGDYYGYCPICQNNQEGRCGDVAGREDERGMCPLYESVFENWDEEYCKEYGPKKLGNGWGIEPKDKVVIIEYSRNLDLEAA